MKKIIIVIVALLSIKMLHAQSIKKMEFSNDTTLPNWVKLMCANNIDLGAIVTEHNAYYKTHPFKKTAYTQYYKHLLQKVSRDYNGTSLGHEMSDEMKNNQFNYWQIIKNRHQKKSKSSNSSWRCIGPFDFDKTAASASYAAGSSHIYTTEQSVSNSNILYAGTANAGLWKTADKGLHWSGCTLNELITEVYALEIDYTTSNTVYFSDGQQIYKTTDGGLTFNKTGNSIFQSAAHYTNDIKMNPANNQVLLAACENGLYRTDDAGQTWNMLQSGAWQELEVKPGDTSIWYAIHQTGNVTQFFKSLDGGRTFTIRTTGWPSPTGADENKRAEIAVTSAAANIIYAFATGAANAGSGLYGIYVSHDAGESWAFKCCGAGPGGVPNAATNKNLCAWAKDGSDDGGQFYYDVALAISPIDSNEVHCGAVNHWVSKDGGVNFVCPSKWSESQNVNYVHADIHDMNFYGNDFWIACDGGVFYSDDGGDTINKKMFGIAGTDFWGFGMGYWQGSDVFVGGAYHNGTLIKDNNVYQNGWISGMGGDNILGNVNYGNERQIFCDYGKFKLSGNRTVGFAQLPNGMQPSSSYIVGQDAEMEYDPACYNIIYMGSDSGFWKSNDGGANFNLLHQFTDGTVASIEIANDRKTFYVCTFSNWWSAKKLYVSNDTGNTWVNITPTNTDLNNTLYAPFDIAVGDSANHVWIARTIMSSTYPHLNGYKVYKSTDAGNSWINITTPTLNGEYLTNIVHQKGSNGGVYLGTRRAVYYRNNTMSDWQLFNDSLPAVTNSTQLIINYKNKKIYNGTNRSAYQCDLYESNFKPIAQISVDKLTATCLRDTFYFTDHSTICNTNASWNWSFPGGTPSSSTLRSPKIKYQNPGKYSVTLSVADINGSNTQTLSNFITVQDNCSADTIPDKALQLNGINASASIEPLNLNTNTITFTAWIKPDAVQKDYSGIIFLRGSSTANGISVMQNLDLRYHWNNSNWWWSSGLHLIPNQWNHIALVVSALNTTIYLNGISAVNSIANNFEAFTDAIKLGVDGNNGTNRNFKGEMDEVCIYNRSLSQNEIREQMHLTKNPAIINGLMAYYQFNEPNGIILDKATGFNALPSASCNRIISTAPVGGGNSSRLSVNAQGNILFGNTGCSINFSNPNPNGEVVVSRLNVHPDQLPNSNNSSKCYWIIDNYGTNNSIANFNGLQLNNVGNITTADASNPSQFNLYQRAWNADGNTWANAVDSATQATSGFNGALTFSTNVPINVSSQIVVSSRSNQSFTSAHQLTNSATNQLKLYPSPIQIGGVIYFKNENKNEKTDCTIYNVDGKKIIQLTFENTYLLNTSSLIAGNYFYQFKTDNKIQNGVFVIID
jgi:photosystem II stability/assembly factor-like uncharacterized protein/PKD repeat protein